MSAQPSVDAAYTAPGNPASSTQSEKATASQIESSSKSNASARAVRQPPDPNESYDDNDHSHATQAPLFQGESSSRVEGEEARGATTQDTDRSAELDGEQMSAPGEGHVAASVRQKSGAGGKQEDLAAGMAAKKQEQSGMRQDVKSERADNRSVDGSGFSA